MFSENMLSKKAKEYLNLAKEIAKKNIKTIKPIPTTYFWPFYRIKKALFTK
jgi:hypothetical protein